MRTALVNISRILLSLTFILSGFVKAVDPRGTQYKLQDYLEALNLAGVLPEWSLLVASVVLSTLEFSLGVFLLFAINRRLTSKAIALFMTVMTCITVWIYIADPVSDCGCFGDALILTNGETLLKNIILLAMAAIVVWQPMRMPRFVGLNNQWIVRHYTVFFSLGISAWSLYSLPVFDFRPYHIGVSISEGMQIPDDAEQPEFETTFILEKDGVRKEFALDDYPDSTWTFIDSKTIQTKQGYVPPIHDFSIKDERGDDITDSILQHKGYTFLLVAPHLESANDSNFGNIDLIYEYAQENGYAFHCLTASGTQAQARWSDITGAEYPFHTTDDITLKTIIRSNPGLVLLHNDTIIGKWSHNMLPVDEMLSQPLEKSELGHKPDDKVGITIIYLLLWFVLPLTILTIADRLWMWSRWIKRPTPGEVKSEK